MQNTTKENNIIFEILNKNPLTEKDIFFGKKSFYSNPEKIEIDITFDCNLKCKCSNRSCGKVPFKEIISSSWEAIYRKYNNE